MTQRRDPERGRKLEPWPEAWRALTPLFRHIEKTAAMMRYSLIVHVSKLRQIHAMPGAGHNPVARLTNRSAWLSLAAALFFFVGLLTFGTAVQKTEDVAVRAASGAPFGVAVGGAMWARATRAKLRALRAEADVSQQANS
jgi:hypothetical protein